MIKKNDLVILTQDYSGLLKGAAGVALIDSTESANYILIARKGLITNKKVSFWVPVHALKVIRTKL